MRQINEILILAIGIIFIVGCDKIATSSPLTSVLKYQSANEWCNNSTTWRNETCIDACNLIQGAEQLKCQNDCAQTVQDIATLDSDTNGQLDLTAGDIWVNK